MRASLVLSLAFVASLVLSGCVQGGDLGGGGAKSRRGSVDALGRPAISPDWAEAALAGGDGHDHRDPRQHQNRSTPNFAILGWNPLITDYHQHSAGGYFCGETVEKAGRRLSVVHSWVSDVAFIISDVTDAARPQKIGEFVMANTHVYDLAMTQDQTTVLLSTSPGFNSLGIDPNATLADDAAPRAFFRDACTGKETPVTGPEQGLPFASGIVVVDITNPRAPGIVDFRFFPVNGGHSVQTREIDGRNLLLISVPNGGLPVAGNPTGVNSHSYYVLAELQETAAGRKINVLSVYQYAAQPSPVPGQKIPGGLHDGYLQKHPVTGKWLAYLAYGASGLVVLDITDPGNPQFLAHWNDWSPLGKAAPSPPFVHEALPIATTWDGHHYTFIGEECGGRRPATPTCLVAVLDTTDPTRPTYVGAWTLPVDVQWSGFAQFSPHYLGLVNRTLFVTNYHGGLWAVDASSPQALADLPSVGVFLPASPSPKPVGHPTPYDFAPVVLDVNPLSDGTMVVYDGTTGLYTVRFDATYPAPALRWDWTAALG